MTARASAEAPESRLGFAATNPYQPPFAPLSAKHSHRIDGLVPSACESAEGCFSFRGDPDVRDEMGLLPSARERPPLDISSGLDSFIGSSTSAQVRTCNPSGTSHIDVNLPCCMVKSALTKADWDMKIVSNQTNAEGLIHIE